MSLFSLLPRSCLLCHSDILYPSKYNLEQQLCLSCKKNPAFAFTNDHLASTKKAYIYGAWPYPLGTLVAKGIAVTAVLNYHDEHTAQWLHFAKAWPQHPLVNHWTKSILESFLPLDWRELPALFVPNAAWKSWHLLDTVQLQWPEGLSRGHKNRLPQIIKKNAWSSLSQQKKRNREQRHIWSQKAYTIQTPRVDSHRELYEKVVLVDDIVSTGATLTQCSRLLLESGITKNINIFALAWNGRK